jgi:hypothetical protein
VIAKMHSRLCKAMFRFVLPKDTDSVIFTGKKFKRETGTDKRRVSYFQCVKSNSPFNLTLVFLLLLKELTTTRQSRWSLSVTER